MTPASQSFEGSSGSVSANVAKARLEKSVSGALKTLEDGFQLKDVSVLLRSAVVFAEVAEATPREKKELAMLFFNTAIDEVKLPWWLGWVARPILKRIAPDLVDLLVDATNGLLPVNQSAG